MQLVQYYLIILVREEYNQFLGRRPKSVTFKCCKRTLLNLLFKRLCHIPELIRSFTTFGPILVRVSHQNKILELDSLLFTRVDRWPK